MIFIKRVIVIGILGLTLFSGLQAQLAVLQYRHVPQENISEFLHRETTYWSEVAQKAIDDGKLLQWGLWQRFGGVGMDEDSYNFVFVNVLPDKTALDNMGDIWNPGAALPGVRPSDIETGSLSHVVHQMVVWFHEGAGKQGNFVRVNYAKVSDLDNYVAFETEVWRPFITKMMEEKKSSFVGWGLGTVGYPSGSSLPFNAFSVDHFDTLSEAVWPTWEEGTEFPDFTEYEKTNDRIKVQIYGLVKGVSAENNE